MKFRQQIFIALIIVLAVYVPAAQAQAILNFSGGANTPISVNLQASVTYTMTAPCRNPIPVFKNVGNPLGGVRNVTGTITHAVNGGTAKPFTSAGAGFTTGDIAPNDLFMNYSNSVADPVLPIGTTFAINVGTLSTSTIVSVTPPPSGSFTTYLVCPSNNLRASGDGTPVTTAASVAVSGRVLVSANRPLANTVVTLNDSMGNTFVSTSNQFGYYQFDAVEVGQTVIVSVASKRFQFAPEVLMLNEEILDLDIIALDQ